MEAKTPLKVLIVEDSEDDSILILRQLKSGGLEPAYERVETAAAMDVALDRNKWDIVISDYALPSFNGLDALKLLQNRGLDLPFILVSGTIGEDIAVEAMRAGAHDYLMKGNLSRLVQAVKREIREAKVRDERRRAEEELSASREKYQTIFENTGTAMVIIREDTTITLANREFERLSGYSKEEIEGKKKWTAFVAGDDLDKMEEYHRMRRLDQNAAPKRYEFQFTDRHGNVKEILLTVDMIPRTGESVASLLDITDRKGIERELKKRIKELEEFYNIAIGRELRMKELKDNLEKLRKELDGYRKA